MYHYQSTLIKEDTMTNVFFELHVWYFINSPLALYSTGAFYAMKATLSYHHARLKTTQRLKDMDYFLVVPFVLVAKNSISRYDVASRSNFTNSMSW